MFQTVQRRLPCQRPTARTSRRETAQLHRQCRVMPKLIVVVDVLVAQHNPQRTLTHQPLDRVFLGTRRPTIGEARRKPLQQSQPPIGPPQKQRPRSDVIVPPSNAASTPRPSTASTQTNPRYSVFASEFLLGQSEVVATQQLSQSPCSDAPNLREISGLARRRGRIRRGVEVDLSRSRQHGWTGCGEFLHLPYAQGGLDHTDFLIVQSAGSLCRRRRSD